MSQNKRPHTAVIMVQIEVYPNLDTGECSGNPIRLSEEMIAPVQVFHIKGFDKFECLKKLKAALAELSK